MGEIIGTFIAGIALIVIGIFNRKGNISMMHSYHRKRVSEEDIIPFGKKIGLGMLIIGAAIVVSSICLTITYFTENKIFEYIGVGIMILSLIAGLSVIFAAMKKYNKGVF